MSSSPSTPAPTTPPIPGMRMRVLIARGAGVLTVGLAAPEAAKVIVKLVQETPFLSTFSQENTNGRLANLPTAIGAAASEWGARYTASAVIIFLALAAGAWLIASRGSADSLFIRLVRRTIP